MSNLLAITHLSQRWPIRFNMGQWVTQTVWKWVHVTNRNVFIYEQDKYYESESTRHGHFSHWWNSHYSDSNGDDSCDDGDNSDDDIVMIIVMIILIRKKIYIANHSEQ